MPENIKSQETSTDDTVSSPDYSEELGEIKEQGEKANTEITEIKKQSENTNTEITEIHKEITTLQENLDTVQENSSGVQEVVLSNEQLEKLKVVSLSEEQVERLNVKYEKELNETVSIYFSVLVGILLAYVFVKGLFSHWKSN